MKTDHPRPKTISEYIAGFPRPVQTVLKRVRGTIRKAVPGSEEAISYGIPTIKLNGRNVLYFAGWAEHYSLYPADDRLVTAFKKDLAPYELSGKGTVRFPLNEPVPEKLIADIAKFRAKGVAERERARAASRKRTPATRAARSR
jgi:uncharacterized protein YdhG (YjbR/CyaY superfamily)